MISKMTSILSHSVIIWSSFVYKIVKKMGEIK